LLSGEDLGRKTRFENPTLSKGYSDTIQRIVEDAEKHPSLCHLDALNGGPRALDMQSVVFPEREAKLTSLLTFLRIEYKSQMNTN